MQQINDQVTNPADPDGTLTADEFNDGIKTELQSLVTQTSQSFDQADQTQLGKAVAAYAAGGDYLSAGGTVDAIILSATGSKVAPDTYIDGQVIKFLPSGENTTSVTVNVGGAGAVPLYLNGSALTGGEITTSNEVVARYSAADGRFNIVNIRVNSIHSTSIRVGFNDPIPNGFGVNPASYVAGNTGAESSFMVARFSNDNLAPFYNFLKSRSTDPASKVACQVSDVTGQLAWSSDNGTSIEIDSRILCTIDSIAAGPDNVTKMTFRNGGDVLHAELTASSDWINVRPGGSGGPGNLGTGSFPWQSGTVNVAFTVLSDATEKHKPRAFNDKELDALESIEPLLYQMISSVEEKGEDKARLHSGAISQLVKKAFDDHGLDAGRYGFWCYDEFPEQEIVYVDEPEMEKETVHDKDGKEYHRLVPKTDSDGNIVTKKRDMWAAKKDKKGNPVMKQRYSLRYEELLMALYAVSRRRCSRLEDRVTALEGIVNA